MATKLGLFGLPLAMFRLIIDLLETNDVYTFRLVSRACRALSEPLIFRSVILHDRIRAAKDVNENICDRLCDSRDALSQHVRCLEVGPFKQEVYCPGEQVLVKVLYNLEDLRQFSWNMRSAIPSRLLEALSTKWPAAQLHVTNVQRNQSEVYIPLDTNLLSSPQLHSLIYTIYGAWIQPTHRVFEYRSEFAALRKCLIQAKRLKHLRLVAADSSAPEQSSWTAGPQNLDLQDGHVFPALEELALSIEGYSLTESHCQQWLAAMDWSSLRRLDLGHGSPRHLFAALTSRVAQLKALSFGFWPIYSTSAIWDCPDLTIIRRFLESIEGLEEVIVENFHAREFGDIRDSFLAKHGRTLRKLHVSYCVADAKGWGCTDVRRLAEQCPGLQDLALKLAMVTDTTVSYQSTVWPDATMAEIRKLRHLCNLHLELQLDENSHEFIVSSNKILIEEAAQNRAIALFTQLQGNSSVSIVRSMTVTFKVTIPVKSWNFIVTRRSGPGKGFVVAKRFVGTEPVGMDGSEIVTPLGTNYDPFG